jgi:hypothetical protein
LFLVERLWQALPGKDVILNDNHQVDLLPNQSGKFSGLMLILTLQNPEWLEPVEKNFRAKRKVNRGQSYFPSFPLYRQMGVTIFYCFYFKSPH